MRLPRKPLFLLLGLISVGCTTIRGRPFEIEQAGALELGETDRRAITSRLGAPTSIGFRRANQFEYTTHRYFYEERTDRSIRARSLLVGFGPNDRLAFFSYESNFDSDSTDFDASVITPLTPGHTTAGEVRELLGEPNGRRLHLRDDRLLEVWTYSVHRTENLEQVIGKRADLTFDEKKRLIELHFDGQGYIAR